jgi:hypothetical protein
MIIERQPLRSGGWEWYNKPENETIRQAAKEWIRAIYERVHAKKNHGDGA